MSIANKSKLKNIFGIPTDKLWIYPVFFGTFLRLYGLVASSIWHDEGYTMWLLKYNPLEIIERTARDVHPPGYYLIAKLWVTVFGTSAFSIRFLSLLFSVGIICLAYKIIEKIFSREAAFWASTLVAFSPFMVRFAQEARMYGVVAFFTTLAVYFFIQAYLNKKRVNLYLILYTLSMISAMYTQYYSFFVIISLWVIYAFLTPEFRELRWIEGFRRAKGVFCWKWWLSNAVLVVLYLPWFPVAYKQVTRVGGSYWIKPEWINARTLPNNVLQFVFYNHMDTIYNSALWGKVFYWLVVITLIGAGFVLLYRKDLQKRIALLLLYGYMPMILVFVLSKLRTPVYQDRYFPFCAVSILALWGVGISIIKNKRIRMVVGGLVLVILLFGNIQMHIDTSHRMKALSEAVKKEMRPGDIVLSGELYTFLDGTYYFGDKKIRLISSKVDGYGESSLFYDQQEQYVVSESEAVALGTQNRIFIVGKTGDKKYFTDCLLGSSKNKVIYEDARTNGVKAVLYEE
jgi:hypothetical protein